MPDNGMDTYILTLRGKCFNSNCLVFWLYAAVHATWLVVTLLLPMQCAKLLVGLEHITAWKGEVGSRDVYIDHADCLFSRSKWQLDPLDQPANLAQSLVTGM